MLFGSRIPERQLVFSTLGSNQGKMEVGEKNKLLIQQDGSLTFENLKDFPKNLPGDRCFLPCFFLLTLLDSSHANELECPLFRGRLLPLSKKNYKTTMRQSKA